MSKFCTNCGNKLPDDAMFCNNCGVVLNVNKLNNQVNNANYNMNYNQQPMNNSSSLNTMCLIGFIMSFVQPVVGLVLSIIGLNQIKKSNENGKGFAIAGIAISSVLLALLIIYFIFVFSIMFMAF